MTCQKFQSIRYGAGSHLSTFFNTWRQAFATSVDIAQEGLEFKAICKKHPPLYNREGNEFQW